VPELRGNSYVLTHNPGMFQVWGVNAGQMSMAVTNPGYVDQLTARFTDGVYLHWNFWCNTQDPKERQFCTTVLRLRPGDQVREYREQDQHFVLYRLKSQNGQH